MDTQIVEVRKNIIISRELTDTNKFSANINIDFIPDEMIVKHIVYTIEDPDDPDNYSSSIYTNLVSDYIGTFSEKPSSNSVSPNIIFTMRKPINGVYDFTLLSPDSNTNNNEMIEGNRTGDLTIHLEFIKYKTVKTGKIY